MGMTREDIDKQHHNGRPAKRVAVPEWGSTVNLREPTQAEVEDMVARRETLNIDNLGVPMLELCLCDDAGERLYGTGELPDPGARVGMRLFKPCKTLCGLDNDADQLVAETAKN